MLTAEQYLELERAAEWKSEFFEGAMLPMPVVDAAHNGLVWNLIGEIAPQLDSTPCHGYPGAMRVRVSPIGLFTYPDVVVVCGEPKFLDDH